MKTIKSSMLFYLSCVLFVLFSGVNCQSQNNDQFLTTKYGNHSDGCQTEFSCTDCRTVKICKRNYYGSLRKILEFQCGDSKPYCDQDTGTCSKTTDKIECNESKSNFSCSSNGFYPNPYDCHKYYICAKGLAYEMDCGVDYYNPKSENCNKQNFCNTINCYGKSGVKVPHESDPSFYGYCYEGSKLIAFEKCPGRFQLDTNKQQCLPVCEKEGLQGDPYDCTKYYKCSYEYSSILSSYSKELSHQTCNTGEYFNAVNLKCAPLEEGFQCSSGFIYTDDGKFVHKDNL